MGNICRSPTAHGVFRDLVHSRGLHQQIRIDSAGTHNYHPGSPPDPYYGGDAGFEHVLDLIEDACEGLLEHVQHRLTSNKN